jgi:hypothetical protein
VSTYDRVVAFQPAGPSSFVIGGESPEIDARAVANPAASVVRPQVPGPRVHPPDRLVARDGEPSRPSLHHDPEPGRDPDDAVTLRLHGDLSRDEVPQLQAVLDGVLLLQPTRLIIDLSDVTSVSHDVLGMITTCEVADGYVIFRSPSQSFAAPFMGASPGGRMSPDTSPAERVL